MSHNFFYFIFKILHVIYTVYCTSKTIYLNLFKCMGQKWTKKGAKIIQFVNVAHFNETCRPKVGSNEPASPTYGTIIWHHQYYHGWASRPRRHRLSLLPANYLKIKISTLTNSWYIIPF